VGSFGINAVELPPGESIPEHDETERAHEEVFLVLEGSPTLVVDGADHALRAGSFARLDPEPKRTVRNDGDALARVLIVSAPVTSGYEPLDWA
jgi:(S)-ureidoglycine aminohydrolase